MLTSDQSVKVFSLGSFPLYSMSCQFWCANQYLIAGINLNVSHVGEWSKEVELVLLLCCVLRRPGPSGRGSIVKSCPRLVGNFTDDMVKCTAQWGIWFKFGSLYYVHVCHCTTLVCLCFLLCGYSSQTVTWICHITSLVPRSLADCQCYAQKRVQGKKLIPLLLCFEELGRTLSDTVHCQWIITEIHSV